MCLQFYLVWKDVIKGSKQNTSIVLGIILFLIFLLFKFQLAKSLGGYSLIVLKFKFILKYINIDAFKSIRVLTKGLIEKSQPSCSKV